MRPAENMAVFFSVEKGQKCIFSINIRNKEKRYTLIVYSLGRSCNTCEAVCLYSGIKPKYFIVYFRCTTCKCLIR